MRRGVNLVRKAHGVVGRNVETTALGEEAGILVELAHPETRLVGRADLQVLAGMPSPTQTGAAADGSVVTGAGDTEILEDRGLETLTRQDRRYAKGVTAIGAQGPGRRDEELRQVHRGVRRRAGGERVEEWSLVTRVHPAVAEDGETEGDAAGESGLVGEVRNIEAAVFIAVEGVAAYRDAAIGGRTISDRPDGCRRRRPGPTFGHRSAAAVE